MEVQKKIISRTLGEEIANSILHGTGVLHVVWHVFVLAGAVCHFWAEWFLS
ncbi:MAG: hypothetical protein LBG26_07890 [Treponema sp.]|nr:hypothetical protein [Treponema sp.]